MEAISEELTKKQGKLETDMKKKEQIIDQQLEKEHRKKEKLSQKDAELDDIKFASSVALFGMILTDSEHKGSATIEDVINLAKSSKGNDGKGNRQAFINLATQYSKKK